MYVSVCFSLSETKNNDKRKKLLFEELNVALQLWIRLFVAAAHFFTSYMEKEGE